MNGLTKSFSNLESRADALSAAQSKQVETQSRLNGQMEVDMKVAQGYLSDVASRALELQATVSETSSKIQSMTTFAKAFGMALDWTATLLIIVLLVLFGWILRVIWRFSPLAGWTLCFCTGSGPH